MPVTCTFNSFEVHFTEHLSFRLFSHCQSALNMPYKSIFSFCKIFPGDLSSFRNLKNLSFLIGPHCRYAPFIPAIPNLRDGEAARLIKIHLITNCAVDKSLKTVF